MRGRIVEEFLKASAPEEPAKTGTVLGRRLQLAYIAYGSGRPPDIYPLFFQIAAGNPIALELVAPGVRTQESATLSLRD